MTDTPPFDVTTDSGFPVTLPSGAEFLVLTRDEVNYITDRVHRYLGDNKFCVPADTQVLTPDGPRPVEECDQRIVFGYDDGLKPAKAIVTTAAPQPLVTIDTGSRCLRCSPNHPVLCAAEQNEKRVGSRGAPRKHLAFEWREAGDIKRGDRVLAWHGWTDEGTDLIPTRVASEGFVEFCGLFTGDGFNVAGRYVRFGHAKDAPYASHYRGVMETEFVKLDGSPVAAAVRGQGTYTEIGSKAAVDELEALGLTGGSLGKRVPSWVFSLNSKLRAAYLRGYIDSDGSINKKTGRIEFGSPNHLLINDIWHLCISLGLPVGNIGRYTSTQQTPQGRTYRTEVSTFAAVNAAANATIGSYKQEAEVWEQGLPRQFDGSAVVGRNRRIQPPPNAAFYTVRSVETGPVTPMYDVMVPGPETFIANGVITHNTNVSDLQDIDRMCMFELFVHRWSLWISKGVDYFNEEVNEKQLSERVRDYSSEIRQLKKTLGVDKVARDKARGDDSVDAYLRQLRARAAEFGVMRNDQFVKTITLFQQLKALIGYHDRTDEVERIEGQVTQEDVFDWIRNVAIPEFDEIDEKFREEKQRYWVRSQ